MIQIIKRGDVGPDNTHLIQLNEIRVINGKKFQIGMTFDSSEPIGEALDQFIKDSEFAFERAKKNTERA